MTSIETVLTLAIALGAAIGTVGMIALMNRRSIARLKDALWGPERSHSGGLEGQQESLADKIDDMRQQQRRIERDRIKEHNQVRAELEDIDEQMRDSFSALSEQLEDVDSDDIVPEGE